MARRAPIARIARVVVALGVVVGLAPWAVAAPPSHGKKKKKSDARVSAVAKPAVLRAAASAPTAALSAPPPAPPVTTVAVVATAPPLAPAPSPLAAPTADVASAPHDDGLGTRKSPPPPPPPPAYAFDAQRPMTDTVSGSRSGKDEGASPCLIGNFCVGPVVALGAVNALGIGAHGRYGRYFGIGFDYQATPKIGGESLKIGTSAYTIAARVYPFGNGLFVSAGIGGQTIRVHATDTGVGVDANAQATGLAFGLGYMGSNGLIVGIDASVLVPLQAANVAVTGVTGVPSGPAYLIARARAEERANALAQSVPVVPQVNLLRVGYLF